MMKSPFTPALALAIALAFCLAPPAPAQDLAVGLLLEKAESLEGRGRLDMAAEAWRQVLLAEPDQPDALAGLARAARQEGLNDEAEQYLTRLRQIAPDHPALRQIGEVQVLAPHQARLDEAVRLAEKQQYEAAMMIYREVFGEAPPPGGWSVAYYETMAATPGGWEPATAGLLELTRRYPSASNYKLSLGRLYTYRPETRSKGLELLRSIGPGEAGDEAQKAWRQALIWSGPSPDRIAAFEQYLARYNDPEIVELRDKALANRGDSSAPRAGRELEIAYEALKGENLAEAEQHFRAALDKAPDSPKALAGLGFVRMKQERFASAVEFLTNAQRYAPQDEVIADALLSARFWNFMERGKVALNEGRGNEAVDSFEQAVELRPAQPDALQGLAGALMKLGRWDDAAPALEQLVQIENGNEEAWAQLINARFEARGGPAALAVSRSMPDDVRAKLENKVEHLALMAVIYSETGREEHSREALRRAVQLAAANPVGMPAELRLRLAGMHLRHGDAGRAAQDFQEVIDLDPENLDAWEGALSALIQLGATERAQALLGRVPDDVYYQGMKRPSFLYAAAKLHQSNGALDLAEGFLRKAIEAQPDPNSKEALGLELELAYLYRDRGDAAGAEQRLRKLLDANPESPDAHKAWIALLASGERFREASAAVERLPLEVSTRLIGDPDFVAVLASVYKETGRQDRALRMIEETFASLEIEKRQPPNALKLQYAWLLLDQQGQDEQLFSLLQDARQDPNLAEEQRQEYDEIWLIWSLREADRSRVQGDVERSAAILVAAARMFPQDERVRRALAGALLEAGHAGQAFVVYKSWGLTNAEPGDYLGAIGAAMAVQDRRAVANWLQEGLHKWPQNPDLLTMAGRVAASRGDYKRAESYWEAALRNMQTPAPTQQGSMSSLDPGGSADVGDDLGRLLLAQAGGGPAPGSLSDMSWLDPSAAATRALPSTPPALQPQPTSASVSTPILPSEPAYAPRFGRLSGTSESPTMAKAAAPPAPYAFPESRRETGVRPAAGPTGGGWGDFELPDFERMDNQMAALVEQRRPRSRQQEIEDQIAAIQARNTPTVGVGARSQGRSGREGFETLQIQEADFRASSVLGNRVRFTMSARPTYLDAGQSDGQSTLRLGLLPAGTNFGQQTASGVAGDLEIGTRSFGLRFGTTPKGFLIDNLTYGLRIQPGGGPLTASFNRAPVTDTMLSFAGVRDPLTGRVWGGVMADEFAVRGDFGGAERGMYAKIGYQKITGEQVADNKRYEVTAGGYWQALSRDEGDLTVGLNITGLSYDKNLRYFTLGHGGYFSPQRYLLMAVPFRWRGNWRRQLRYEVGGSFGSQYVREDSSPLFPTSPNLQGVGGPAYDALNQTGAHFSFDSKVEYHVAPNWVVGGFATANNTRNFTSGSAGFFLNYLVKGMPLGQQVNVPPVPDWTGVRPSYLP